MRSGSFQVDLWSFSTSPFKEERETKETTTCKKDYETKRPKRMDMSEENEQPFQLLLKPRTCGRRRGSIANHTLWLMSKGLMDCNSDLEGCEVEEIRELEHWHRYAEGWLREVRDNNVAVIGLMEDENGQIGSLTISDLTGKPAVMPVKAQVAESGWKNLGDWIVLAMPELHQVLRDENITKIIVTPHLAKFLLRQGETEEVLYPTVDPVECAARRVPESFVPRCEGEACSTGPGFGLKAMVWSYLGEQHGPKNGTDQRRRNIKHWPKTRSQRYSKEQLIWSLEVFHASKLCVLDFFLQALPTKEEEQSFVFFGEVLAQVFETQMFRGLRQLQCWGATTKTENSHSDRTRMSEELLAIDTEPKSARGGDVNQNIRQTSTPKRESEGVAVHYRPKSTKTRKGSGGEPLPAQPSNEEQAVQGVSRLGAKELQGTRDTDVDSGDTRKRKRSRSE